MEIYGHYLKNKDGDTFSPVISNSTIYDVNEHNYRDTGWQLIVPKASDTDYSTYLTYINSSQSAYTMNCWRVFNGVLYLNIGVGCSATSTLNSTTEVGFAAIPIGNAWATGTANRFWSPTIGTLGKMGPGIMLRAFPTYIEIGVKPHSSSYLDVTYWGSTKFAIPLDNYTFNKEMLATSIAVTESMYDFEDINPARITVEEYDSSGVLYAVAWWNIDTTHSASNPDGEAIVNVETFIQEV